MDEISIEKGREQDPTTLLCAKVGAFVEKNAPDQKFIFLTCNDDGVGVSGCMTSDALADAFYGLIHKSELFGKAFLAIIDKIQAEA